MSIPRAIDALVEMYEIPRRPAQRRAGGGAAWADPDFRDWLKRDATAAIAAMGFEGRQGEHMVAVENTSEEPQSRRLHPVFLLSLARASALPPSWYKNPRPTARAR